jgi:hypothetical protein
MAIVYSAIDCDEVYGTREESATIEGGWEASVSLQCLSTNKDALIDDLLSNQRPYPNINTPQPPRAYAASAVPIYTELPADGQGYVWNEHVVTVQYTSDPERTLVTETLEPDAEFTRLDHRFFRWAADGGPLTEGEAPGFLQVSLKLKRKYYQAPLVPTDILIPGRVHNAAYNSLLLGLTFPSESLLLTPEPVDRTITTSGSDGYNYAISFSFKPNGWNTYWRPQTQTWDRIVLADGTPYNSYPLANLSSLLS